MAQEAVIVLPTHLFEHHALLDTARPVYLIEDEQYFTAHAYHKQKLILHRASMKAYEALLKKRGMHTHYIEYSKAKNLFSTLKKQGITHIHYYDPVDHDVSERIRKKAKAAHIECIMYETPLFLTSSTVVTQLLGTKKKYLMHHFYVAQRKRLNILVHNGKPIGGSWSFDQENREPLPKGFKVPAMPAIRASAHVKQAQNYVARHFARNPGNARTYIYPITHTAAKKWFDSFLRTRFAHFGTYEDAIVHDEPFLFHSVLSPLLNIGLLTPDYVVEKALAYAKAHKIALNNVEGFIRQIIGWREFVRGIYLIAGNKQRTSNTLKHTKKLPSSFWCASTGIEPVDGAIKRVLTYAYAHHIERLMILGNYMLISQISPHEVYRWFMELFIDAYDWVMVPNVYGMSQYADGGLMTTKPYFSSSRYILSMSDYQRGAWCDTWDKAFHAFVRKHLTLFKKIPRMRLMLTRIRT
jgi:deoxyribodipyrimidine photolyase-related protein